MNKHEIINKAGDVEVPEPNPFGDFDEWLDTIEARRIYNADLAKFREARK